MRYSESHAAETRVKVVREAAAQIRRNGPGNVSVAGVMSAAGLTHGGFYAHFRSKDDLVAGAMEAMFEQARDRFFKETQGREGSAALAAFIDYYVSPTHRDHPERGCPVTALANDLPRLRGKARKTYDAGVQRMIDRIAVLLPGNVLDRDALALSLVAEMVGAVALSRALSEPVLSDGILKTARQTLKARAGIEGALA